MTPQEREVMQMALDALEHGLPIIEDYGGKRNIQLQHKAIAVLYEALRAALATEQEPVAWGFQNTGITGSNRWMYLKETIPKEDQYRGVLWTPLYTAPPRREFVGLTDEDIADCERGNVEGVRMLPYSFARAIEAKLKEKNGNI